MSAIGSVIVALYSNAGPKAPGRQRHPAPAADDFLPATLRHARDVARQGQFAETQTAQREFAHVGARTSASAAAVTVPHLELQGLSFACFLRARCHSLS